MADDHQHSGQFDASLPLPDEVKLRGDEKKPAEPEAEKENPAAELIRKKIEAVYHDAPPAAEEIEEVKSQNSQGQATPTNHQQFIDDLINSGKSLPEIQTSWHEYYAGLTDIEKHRVWQEFYNAHEEASHFAEAAKAAPRPVAAPARIHQRKPRRGAKQTEVISKKVSELRQKPAPTGRRKASPLHSLAFGLGIGCMVLLIFLFSFFNERFIAPFIQPSRNATNTPIITASTAVGPSPEVIIPKINVQIPVVYTVNTIDDTAIENALENGVVHYATTALPGQDGNGVIVGHSSNNIFNPGKYKFAFVLLSRLDTGDTFYLQKGGVRYTYEVYKKTIVPPTDVSVLGPQEKKATFSLITCDPPGTSTNRLVVVGEQISPSPNGNRAEPVNNVLASSSTIIPGNSPTLWSRIVHWLKS